MNITPVAWGNRYEAVARLARPNVRIARPTLRLISRHAT